MTVARRRLLARTKLWPGEPGTKALLERYGARLVCVRYLYDPQTRVRYTTVEVVVREGPWRPRHEAQVGIRVQWGEPAVVRRIREAGGTWDRDAKLWRLGRATALTLGLAGRLVPLPAKGGRRTQPRRRADSAPCG